MIQPDRWALEAVTNPSVLRLHLSAPLTDRTIVSCPPEAAPEPLDRLLAIPGFVGWTCIATACA